MTTSKKRAGTPASRSTGSRSTGSRSSAARTGSRARSGTGADRGRTSTAYRRRRTSTAAGIGTALGALVASWWIGASPSVKIGLALAVVILAGFYLWSHTRSDGRAQAATPATPPPSAEPPTTPTT